MDPLAILLGSRFAAAAATSALPGAPVRRERRRTATGRRPARRAPRPDPRVLLLVPAPRRPSPADDLRGPTAPR